MKKSSLTFFIQYGVEVGILDNEKDKEEEYVVGVAQVNKIELVEKVSWLVLPCTSFSLLIFIFIWSSWTSLGERGFKVTLRPWKEKDIMLDRPSCKNVYHIANAFLKEHELLPWV